MEIEKINILIVGGGTGGHISPGIALYEELRGKGSRAYILVGRQDKGFSPLKSVNDKALFYYGAPSFTKNIILVPFFIINFTFAMLKAYRIIKKLQIDTVIGMGGFVSAPALVVSRFIKLPFYLCEQNTVPGMVTSLFARFAEKIFTTFEITKNHIREEYQEKVLLAGNPVRKCILSNIDTRKNDAMNYFSLGHCKKVILVIGGSQGALRLNELLIGLKRDYSSDFKDVGFIWCTGKYSYKKYKETLHEGVESGSTYLSPFISDVGLAYRASDIAISRAGAGVMMEFASFSLPSILIPYPFAADGHQEMNADVFVRAGAALKISNKDAVPEKVAPILTDILRNSSALGRMSEKSKAISKINASSSIIENILGEITSKYRNKESAVV